MSPCLKKKNTPRGAIAAGPQLEDRGQVVSGSELRSGLGGECVVCGSVWGTVALALSGPGLVSRSVQRSTQLFWLPALWARHRNPAEQDGAPHLCPPTPAPNPLLLRLPQLLCPTGSPGVTVLPLLLPLSVSQRP